MGTATTRRDRCRTRTQAASGGERLGREPTGPPAKRWREPACHPDWEWTKREHEYDATNRLVNSTYKQWLDAEEEPSGDSLEHTYSGAKHLQNYDGSSSYGEIWQATHSRSPWRPLAGTPPNGPPSRVGGQRAGTSGERCNIRRRTAWPRADRPTGEALVRAGMSHRHLYGQGKPMPKDASGAGTNWGTGIQSDDPAGVLNPLNSRLDFDGTVQPTDLDRATDAREKGRIGIFGSALSYAGSSPRITSEPIGRDINPLGRGSGMALVGGELNLGRITPTLPLSEAHGGNGSSVNNDCGGGCGDLGGDGGGGDKGDLDSGSRMCCYDAKTGNCWDPEYWDGPCVEIPCDSEKCKDSGVKGGGGQGSGGGQFPQYAPTTQICGRWDWTSWNGTNSPRYNTYCPIVNWLSCPWYRCTVSEHYTGWKCVYYKKGSSNTQKRFAWQTIICSGSITWWGIDPRNPLRGFGWHTLWHVCQQRSRVVTMCKVCDKP